MSDIQSEKWAREAAEKIESIVLRDCGTLPGFDRRDEIRFILQSAIDHAVAAAQEKSDNNRKAFNDAE